MEYFILPDQDLDWKPVLQKFVSEYVEAGYLKVRTSYDIHSGSGKRYYITDLARKSLGFESAKQLFNYWYNRKRLESCQKRD